MRAFTWLLLAVSAALATSSATLMNGGATGGDAWLDRSQAISAVLGALAAVFAAWLAYLA